MFYCLFFCFYFSILLFFFFFFFFSSRRRHTRSLRDWSSDVCSSDLRIAHILFLVFMGGAIGVAYGFSFMRAPKLLPVLLAVHVVLAFVLTPQDRKSVV